MTDPNTTRRTFFQVLMGIYPDRKTVSNRLTKAREAQKARKLRLSEGMQAMRDRVGKETTIKEESKFDLVNGHFNADRCGVQLATAIEALRPQLDAGKPVIIAGDYNATCRQNPDGTVSILHKEDKNPDGTPLELWRSPEGYRIEVGFSLVSSTNKWRVFLTQFNKHGKISKPDGAIDGCIIIIPRNSHVDVKVRTQVFIGTGVPGEIREISADECTTKPGFPSDHAMVIITITMDGEDHILATWNICGESGDGGFNWGEFGHEAFKPHLSRFKEIRSRFPSIRLWNKDGGLEEILAEKLIKDKTISKGLRGTRFQSAPLPPSTLWLGKLPMPLLRFAGCFSAVASFATSCIDEHRRGFQVLLDERAKCTKDTPEWKEADNRVRMALYLDEVHQLLISDPVLAPLYRDLFIQKAHEHAGRESAQPFHFIRRALEERNIDTFCLQEVSPSSLNALLSDPWISENYDITTSHDDLSEEEFAKVNTIGVILTRNPAPTAGAGAGEEPSA